ncbi:hypothetical protein Tco_0153986 [Tanacetum coccineum]
MHRLLRILLLLEWLPEIAESAEIAESVEAAENAEDSRECIKFQKLINITIREKRANRSSGVEVEWKKKKTQQPVHDDGACSTPNYMNSTISLEARKEQSPKITTPKVARKLKTDDLASGNKRRTSSLIKNTNFKPSRPSSAKRHALKTQKSFKVGCLSPRPRTPMFKKDDVKVIVATEAPQNEDMEEENRDFFLEIYSKDRQEKGKQDLECLDIDWEEGYCSALFSDNADDFCKEKNQKGDDRLSSKEQLYHGEIVTSRAWLEEEDDDSELDGSYYKGHDL